MPGVSLFAPAVRPLLDRMQVGSRAAGAWSATLGALLALKVFALLVTRWSSASGWGPGHVLAVGSGALIASSAVAFTLRSIGHVPTAAKYATNGALLLPFVTVLATAERRPRAIGDRLPAATPAVDSAARRPDEAMTATSMAKCAMTASSRRRLE